GGRSCCCGTTRDRTPPECAARAQGSPPVPHAPTGRRSRTVRLLYRLAASTTPERSPPSPAPPAPSRPSWQVVLTRQRMASAFRLGVDRAKDLLDRAVVMLSKCARELLERRVHAGLDAEQLFAVEHNAQLQADTAVETAQRAIVPPPLRARLKPS